MRSAALLFVVFLCSLLARCAYVGDGPLEVIEGRYFDVDMVTEIVEGHTTEKEVTQRFGTPVETSQATNNRKTLRYYVKGRSTSIAKSPVKEKITHFYFERELMIGIENGVVISKVFRTDSWVEEPKGRKKD